MKLRNNCFIKLTMIRIILRHRQVLLRRNVFQSFLFIYLLEDINRLFNLCMCMYVPNVSVRVKIPAS
jgi:hypothetical protein